MKYVLAILAVVQFVLISCSETNPNYDSYISKMRTSDIKQAITLANEWRDSEPNITSFVTSKELTVTFPDKRQEKKQLPDSLMYVAVAPYINTTHSCSTHYPSSCQGEMTNTDFTITAKDENNNSFYNGTIKSLPHGFFELWLPRNKTIQLHIKYNDLSADEILITNDGSNTCVTTAKLK